MKIVVLNGAKVNYDGIIDYSVLANEGDELVVCDMCEDHGYTEISEGAEVIISKELPISREDIMALPDTVKLICEAGTGYNNIDLAACHERGIGVCNVPAYSSEPHEFRQVPVRSACGAQREDTGRHRRRKYREADDCCRPCARYERSRIQPDQKRGFGRRSLCDP